MPGGASVFDLEGVLSVDTSQVSEIPAGLQAAVAQVSQQRASIPVVMDDSGAQVQLRALRATIQQFVHDRTIGRIAIDTTLNTSLADAALGNLKARIEQAKADLSTAISMGGADAYQAAQAQAQAQTGGGLSGGSIATGGQLFGPSNMMRGTLALGSMVLGGATIKTAIQKAFNTAADETRLEDSVVRIFGPAGEQMVNYSRAMADATKYLNADLLQAEVELGDAGDAWGISMDQIKRAVQAVTDVAHTTGLPQFKDDINAVTQAIISGTQGRGQGLKKLGINVTDEYMKSLYPDWNKMDVAGQSAARFNVIMQELTDIQGKAATDTQSAAYASRAAAQKMNEAFKELGDKLMPIATWIMNLVAKIPTPVLAGGILGAGAGGTLLGGMMMFGMGRTLIRNAGQGSGGATLEKSAVTAAATLERGAVAAADTLRTGAVVAAGETTTGAGEAGGAMAAGGSGGGVAVGSGGAAGGAAVGTGGGVAAAELEAGGAAAAAELRAGAAGGGGGGLLGDLKTLLGKSGNLLGKLGYAGTGGIGYSGVGTVGAGIVGGAVLALPAMVGTGMLLAYGHQMQKNAEDQLKRDMDTGAKNDLMLAKRTGMRTGMGGEDQTPYLVASVKRNFMTGELMYFNAYGERLSSTIENWQNDLRAGAMSGKPRPGTEQKVTVVLQDATLGGVKASNLNPGSYAP